MNISIELQEKINTFLTAWHENGRAAFHKGTPSLDYDTSDRKTAKPRRRWVALDRGTCGVFLLDPITEEVFTIKAYGVPNRSVGLLSELMKRYKYI